MSRDHSYRISGWQEVSDSRCQRLHSYIINCISFGVFLAIKVCWSFFFMIFIWILSPNLWGKSLERKGSRGARILSVPDRLPELCVPFGHFSRANVQCEQQLPRFNFSFSHQCRSPYGSWLRQQVRNHYLISCRVTAGQLSVCSSTLISPPPMWLKLVSRQ